METMYINAITINDLYQKVLQSFNLNYPIEYQEKSALLVVKCPYIVDLPSSLNDEGLNEYYTEIVKGLKWSKWLELDNWYISYARRLLITPNLKNQVEEAITQLKENSETRRAVLLTNYPTDSIKYRPALISVQFIIRDNWLDTITNWRSKEVRYALPINIAVIMSLSKYVCTQLRIKYDNLMIGRYIEFDSNLHLYEDKSKSKGSLITEFGYDIRLCDNNSIKFLWSIIDKKQEKEYDENYGKQKILDM